MSRKRQPIPEEGIYDARQLGMPRMLLLGLQHMFAMFGATILVPALTGLSVSATLLFAGLGTLLFHLVSKRKVPAFLGASFAFLGGYFAVEGWAKAAGITDSASLLPYACFGVACAGVLYLIMAALIKAFGTNRVMRFFPPVVTGPIIIAIGLCLASSAVNSCETNWLIAAVAIIIVVVCNIFGKGMVKIIPIMLGVIGSTLLAVILHLTGAAQIFETEGLEVLNNAAWIGLPFRMKDTVFSIFGNNFDPGLLITAIITIAPISFATIVEHIGDISAISSTTGQNYIEDPGLNRTLLGDGLATILASLFGAPANTTYGENTGVLTISRVYDPRVIRIAAAFAILFSFSPKFAALIGLMPTATIGGISLILYGMISAVGVRNLVETQTDFTKSRNVVITALIIGLAVGINYSASGALNITIGSVTIGFTGLAVGALVGILLNAVLPDKEWQFREKIKNVHKMNIKENKDERNSN
ncbi:MAG: uracil-xanthine permease [Clostridia bacterium]|nr:uracil-xanthine permease [Clostridia bacterium]